MTLSSRTSWIALTLSGVLAAILDRAVVASQFPRVSNLLLVKPGLVLFNVPVMAETLIGVVPLLVLPLIVLGILLIPFKGLREGRLWRKGWATWKGAALAVLLVPVLMLVGGFLYAVVKDWLPGPIAAVAESFGFKPTFFVWSKDAPVLGPLDGSLACLVGLGCGLWLVQRWLRQ